MPTLSLRFSCLFLSIPMVCWMQLYYSIHWLPVRCLDFTVDCKLLDLWIFTCLPSYYGPSTRHGTFYQLNFSLISKWIRINEWLGWMVLWYPQFSLLKALALFTNFSRILGGLGPTSTLIFWLFSSFCAPLPHPAQDPCLISILALLIEQYLQEIFIKVYNVNLTESFQSNFIRFCLLS